MTVRELLEMLNEAAVPMDAEVYLLDVYGQSNGITGCPDLSVTGMVYDDKSVTLTNESKD